MPPEAANAVRQEFVELDRQFVEFTKDSPVEDGIDWLSFFSGDRLKWDDLLKRRRVVLLAEAASGKTNEFHQRAAQLNSQGKVAFFIAIEALADGDTRRTLTPAEALRLDSWKSGTDEAWLFLDSVDEARLAQKSLDRALKTLAHDLGPALERAFIYLSSRVSDWRGREDLRAVRTALAAPLSSPSVDSEQGGPRKLLAPLFGDAGEQYPQDEDGDQTSRRTDGSSNQLGSNDEPPFVVRFVDLDDDRRQKLARNEGIENAEAFVKAITQHGLDALAQRPGDLIELAVYWKAHKKFGPLVAMVNFLVDRKLSERDEFRPDNTVLALDRARGGAQSIAAALTLAKAPALKSPGQEADATLTVDALDAADILPDWTPAERNALTRRGIFAPASYGRIRFHHRSTQEYLTARWLDGLLKKDCPRREVWDLLFVEQYGVQTIAPSLRPATAWLSLWHDDIRAEALRREPSILLQEGDPGSLPIATKSALLTRYATKHLAGKIPNDRLESRSLWMFAHPDLEQAIREAWALNERDDFRQDLLRLVQEGAISGCADLAEKAAFDPAAQRYLRVVAVQALAACGADEALRRISSELLSSGLNLDFEVTAYVARALFPQHLSVSQLLSLIAVLPPPDYARSSRFHDAIRDLWSLCPKPQRVELLGGIADLCLSKPHVERYKRVSENHKELAERLAPIARDVLTENGAEIRSPEFVRFLIAIERSEHWSSTLDGVPNLNVLVTQNEELNRALIWADVGDERQAREPNDALTDLRHLIVPAPLWKLSERSLPWLYEDLQRQSRMSDRLLAMSGILNLLQWEPALRASEISTLRTRIKGAAELEAELEKFETPTPENPRLKSFIASREQAEREQAEQRKRDEQSWIDFGDKLRRDPTRLLDADFIASRHGLHRLWYLTHWLRRRTRKTTENDAALQWRLLEEGFGSVVAQNYVSGMKLIWRQIPPERPLRAEDGTTRIPWSTLLSFAAIGLEAQDNPQWAVQLSADEGRRAALHGIFADQNDPDWMDDLLVAHPNAVLPIVREELERLWGSAHLWAGKLLHRRARTSTPLPQALTDMMFHVFMSAEASAIGSLDEALHILPRMELTDFQKRALSVRARRHMRKSASANQMAWTIRYAAAAVAVDPSRGLAALRQWIESLNSPQREEAAYQAFADLFGSRYSLARWKLTSLSPDLLKELIALAYREVRPADDHEHYGSYTPDIRDDAEEGRSVVVNALSTRVGADAYAAMKGLASDPACKPYARQFHERCQTMAERDSERPAWPISHIREFERTGASPVRTAEDLYRVVRTVLDDIVFGFEHSDAASRAVLETAENEDAVQGWLAEQFSLRAQSRYHLPREAEVADGNLPDLIVASTAGLYEVAIEVKHGGKDWSVTDFEKSLRHQLAEDYLKPISRRHGMLVITNHRQRNWEHPLTKQRLSFNELIRYLSTIAAAIKINSAGPISVSVLGIDASSKKIVTSSASRGRAVLGAGKRPKKRIRPS